MIITPGVYRHADLPEVVRADDAGGARAGVGQRGQHDECEQKQDSEDDEQFGAGEGGLQCETRNAERKQFRVCMA